MKASESAETCTREILACLGVASRFRLVGALAESERYVGELAQLIGLSQSCTTRHLQVLGRLGLVEGRREGRRVRFRLREEASGLRLLLEWALAQSPMGALAPTDNSDRTRADRARAIESTRQGKAVEGEEMAGSTGSPRRGGVAALSSPDQGSATGHVRSSEESEMAAEQTITPARPRELEDYLL